MKTKSILKILLTIIGLSSILCGCGRGTAQTSAESELPFMRTPRPTFTPTVQPNGVGTASEGVSIEAAAQEITSKLDEPVRSTGVGGPQTEEPQGAQDAIKLPEVLPPTPTPRLGPIGVINSPVVNARKGPGLTYPIVGEVARGTELQILGMNDFKDWWYLCCVNETEVWIIEDFIDTIGAVDSVPVVTILQSNGRVAQAAPTRPQAVAAPTPRPAADRTEISAASRTEQDELIGRTFEQQSQEQFPEDNTTRIFIYVFEGEQALGGYSLNVRHNGTVLPVETASFGGQPGLTWPIADDRQRFQNLKVEFPDEPVGGTWEVQLVDSEGTPVSEIATFNLTNNDTNRELYLRYKIR